MTTATQGRQRLNLFARLAARREARALVVLGLLGATFAALVYLIRTPELRYVDVAITQTLQRPRTSWLDHLAAGLTYAGGGVAETAVFVLVAVLLLVKRRPRAAGLLVLALLAGHPANLLIKSFFGRARPAASDLVEVIVVSSGTSFPSGHAQSGALFFGFVALLAWVLIRSGKLRLGVVLILVTFIFLSGASRVYVGGHWASDVLGGWTVGLFLLFLLAEAYRLIGKGELTPRQTAATVPATGKLPS